MARFVAIWAAQVRRQSMCDLPGQRCDTPCSADLRSTQVPGQCGLAVDLQARHHCRAAPTVRNYSTRSCEFLPSLQCDNAPRAAEYVAPSCPFALLAATGLVLHRHGRHPCAVCYDSLSHRRGGTSVPHHTHPCRSRDDGTPVSRCVTSPRTSRPYIRRLTYCTVLFCPPRESFPGPCGLLLGRWLRADPIPREVSPWLSSQRQEGRLEKVACLSGGVRERAVPDQEILCARSRPSCEK